MGKNVTIDGEYYVIRIPEADLKSMTRFIAHGLYKEGMTEVTQIVQDIVVGDILKQDEYVDRFLKILNIEDWVYVLNGPEALAFCDELADAIYDQRVEDKKPQLRLVTICIKCHKSKIKNEACVCEVKK